MLSQRAPANYNIYILCDYGNFRKGRALKLTQLAVLDGRPVRMSAAQNKLLFPIITNNAN